MVTKKDLVIAVLATFSSVSFPHEIFSFDDPSVFPFFCGHPLFYSCTLHLSIVNSILSKINLLL
jgi:hypothetical protein